MASPWRYESITEKRRRDAEAFGQIAAQQLQQQSAPSGGGGGGGGGGFFGGLKSVVDRATPDVLEDVGRGLLSGYRKVREDVLEPGFAIASGQIEAERRLDPETGQFYREKPGLGDALASWRRAITDPIGAYNEGQDAFDERLRNPAVQNDLLGRSLLETVTAPETIATAGLGGVAGGALRATGNPLARFGANLVEPVFSGSAARRFVGETLLGTGAQAGSEVAGNLLEGAPTPVRVAGSLAGGLLGGVGAANTPRAYSRLLGPEGAAVRGLATAQGRRGMTPAIGGMIDAVGPGADDVMRTLGQHEIPFHIDEQMRIVIDDEPLARNVLRQLEAERTPVDIEHGGMRDVWGQRRMINPRRVGGDNPRQAEISHIRRALDPTEIANPRLDAIDMTLDEPLPQGLRVPDGDTYIRTETNYKRPSKAAIEGAEEAGKVINRALAEDGATARTVRNEIMLALQSKTGEISTNARSLETMEPRELAYYARLLDFAGQDEKGDYFERIATMIEGAMPEAAAVDDAAMAPISTAEPDTVRRVDLFGNETNTFQTEAELNGFRARQVGFDGMPEPERPAAQSVPNDPNAPDMFEQMGAGIEEAPEVQAAVEAEGSRLLAQSDEAAEVTPARSKWLPEERVYRIPGKGVIKIEMAAAGDPVGFPTHIAQLYVTPEARRGTTLARLLRMAEQDAGELRFDRDTLSPQMAELLNRHPGFAGREWSSSGALNRNMPTGSDSEPSLDAAISEPPPVEPAVADLPPAPPPPPPPPDMPEPEPPRYPVPPIATGKAQQAIADKFATLQPSRLKPGPLRRALSFANPSLNQEHGVYIAYNARQSVRSQLATQFDAQMEPIVARLEAVLDERPPVYLGPDDNPFRGTFKDIADHPDHYQIDSAVREALDAYDRAQWEQVSAVARGEYGVDVAPYESSIEGSVYTPTVVKRSAIDSKVEEAAQMSLSAKSRTKTRAYDGAYDRWKRNPDFAPETDLRELTALHNSAMASNAANSTFRVGVGGKSRAEVMAELHPELFARREAAMKRLDSARRRLATAEKRARVDESRAAELHKAMEAVRDAVDEKWYTPIETASRRSSKRIDELLTRGTLRREQAQWLRAEMQDALDELDNLRDAWDAAGVDPYVLNREVNRYLTPEQSASVHELMRAPEGFPRQALDALNEVRAMHLAGDASPIYIQTMLGFWQDPVLAMRTVFNMMGENPRAALQRIAREQADDVAEYTFHTGRQLGKPIAELAPPKGLQRIKGAKRIEENMFAVVSRIQYEQWKADRDLLLRMNPGIAREVAAHEAASAGAKLIPSLNTAERGVSGLRGAVERGFITSTSFASSPALMVKDMSTAIVKLAGSTSASPAARWRALTGREQLSLMRGLTMISTMMTASAATAAAAARSREMSPEDAIKEAFNPASKYFLSLQLGDGAYVPIGGPLRGFIKAMWPPRSGGIPGERIPQWLSGKLTSPISGSYRLATNTDWRGKPIREGNALAQVAQTLSYVVEQVVPISAGGVLEGVRTGEDPRTVATSTIGGMLGANPSLPTPNDRLNELSRRHFGVDNFYDLEPSQQEQIRDQHPDLWNEAVARGSDARQAAAQVKARLQEEQEGDDRLFLSGQMRLEDWKRAMQDRTLELRVAQETIYGDKPRRNRNTPLDRYYAAIDQSMVNGRPDWDAVDEWKAQQTEADRAYIDRNTGLGGTALVQAYRATSADRERYYDLPVYRGYTGDEARAIDDLYDRARATLNLKPNQQATEVRMLRAIRQIAEEMQVDPKVVQGVRRRVLGMLSRTKDRERFLVSHPNVGVFIGSGYPSPMDMSRLGAALAS